MTLCPRSHKSPKSSAAARLVDGPDDLISEGQNFVYEPQEVGLIVSDLSREQPFSRSVEYVGPVGLFARIDSGSGLIHDRLPILVACLPAENSADGSYAASLGHRRRRSLLAVGASRGTEGRFLSSHRTAEQTKPSSVPLSVIHTL